MPIEPMRWTERRWEFGRPAGLFPAIVERLRGASARAEEILGSAGDELLGTRHQGRWSVKEQIGHLDDLHHLDVTRMREFAEGAPVLSAADMTNRATEEASHNAVPAMDIAKRFREHREALVDGLESLEIDVVTKKILHPRLEQEMQLVDWAYFVAEHDDHHLAHARLVLSLLLREAGGS